MATGVKPREDLEFSRNDVEMLGDALKDKNFRKLLSEYCEEMQDPAKQALYQKEMTQLEKERGVDITFINPTPQYVIKTSVAGEKKAFINICSNDKVGKPSYAIKVIGGRQGLDWKLPYSLIPPREDLDKKRVRCVVYDVVFHPNTLELANKYKRFREMVNTTACEALSDAYTITLDQKNFRFPKMVYKGMKSSAVIRKPDPNFKPDQCDTESLGSDILDKVYPQKCYTPDNSNIEGNRGQCYRKTEPDSYKLKNKNDSKSLYTIPKYTIKQQRDIEFQEFTFDRNAKQYTAMPNNLVIQVNLPLISSTADCTLDVKDKCLKLLCEKPARYKLNLVLPYAVDDKLGNAKFDKSRHLLIVTLPVVKISKMVDKNDHSKTDSGVESETNSSASDDDTPHSDLITVLTSRDNSVSSNDNSVSSSENVQSDLKKKSFLDPNIAYIFPVYTHNIMDSIIAFTFHVKNTDQASLVIDRVTSNSIQIKFTSIGSGFVPIHYSLFIKFIDISVILANVSGEAWDNNVILQIETEGKMPEFFSIGSSEHDLKTEVLDLPLNSLSLTLPESMKSKDVNHVEVSMIPPVVEVRNVSLEETNITVTSNDSGSDSSTKSKPTNNKSIDPKKQIVWADIGSSTDSPKGILRNSWQMVRSWSESSYDGRDVASSMDYISSESIPEESRLKKTVRFSEVIAEKLFRPNCSILGKKKKNQKKREQKKKQGRRKSESEADDDQEPKITTKPTMKSESKKNGANEKLRRDSGVADTSDTDGNNDENRSGNDPCEAPQPEPCLPLHKTGLYDPQKLNQGQYLEVSFQNDLIFDLDL